jgi:hypothetical protein
MFYPQDNSVEMFCKRTNKIFLKRVETPKVSLEDLYLGAKVTIFARVLEIVDYGDIATKNKFATGRESTFAMIKPDSYANFGKIIDAIQKEGFVINKLKMSKFSPETAGIFYGEHQGKPFY